jgi:hypothetical protein
MFIPSELKKLLSGVAAPKFDPNLYDPKVCQRDACGNIIYDGCGCLNCEHIIERKILPNSSLSKFFYKRVSKKFIDKTKFRCIIPDEYNFEPDTIIDNHKQIKYGDSMQNMLVRKGIKTEKMADDTVLRYKNRHHTPHRFYNRDGYQHLGFDGSTSTGLPPHLRSGYYFDVKDC